jgi:hypothetical protein
MPIIQNSLNGRAVSRDVANASYTVADFELEGETITAVDIAQVYWCGTWDLTRNGNTILSLVNGDNWFLEGVTLLKEEDGNDVTLTNSGNGSIIIVYKKVADITSEDY